MAYTPEQRRNIATALRLTSADSPRVRQALLEAMAVESNFRNLNYGDRDSMGVLQQRRQYYPHSGQNVAYDIAQFLQRARRADKQVGGSAGQLAQAVQRSAFPGRYDQRAQEASKLLGGNFKGSPAVGVASRLAGNGGVPGPTLNDTTNMRNLGAQYFLQASQAAASGDPVASSNALLQLAFAKRALGGAQITQAQAPTGQSIAIVHGKLEGATAKAVNIVKDAIGTPYVWGGAKPGGFDCSGLLQYAWGKAGVKIPRVTYDQWRAGKAVGRTQLQAGDAVFFRGSDSKNGLPGHVGMYIGGGRFIEAPKTGDVVHISNLAGRSDYMGARRF